VGLDVGVALVAALPNRAHRRIVVSMVANMLVGKFLAVIDGLESGVRARKVVLVCCVRWFGLVGVGDRSE